MKHRSEDDRASNCPKHILSDQSHASLTLQVYFNTLVPFVTRKYGVLWLRAGWCRESGKNMGREFISSAIVFRMNILERWNALSDQLQEVWNTNSITKSSHHCWVSYSTRWSITSPLRHHLHRLRAQMDYPVRLGIHPSHFVCAAPSDPYRLEGEWSFFIKPNLFISYTLRSIHFIPLVPYLVLIVVYCFFPGPSCLDLPDANVVKVLAGRLRADKRWTALCIPNLEGGQTR